uniref:Major facilitator superfamily (MFS) profile domain-containing protein n=1 Tax=Globodera rostochiensis TaxID=31243 RepID=A0A914I9G7_GLORO
MSADEAKSEGAKVTINMQDRNEQKSLINSNSKAVHIIDPAEAANSLGAFKETEPAVQRIALKTYPRRWVVLAVVALLNNLNTMLWIAFSPISNHVDTFYGKDSTIYFSAVFVFVTIPVGIVAMWAGGRFGLRASILVAAWTNGIGAAIRLSSSFLPDSMIGFRFPIGISGQGIAALAYPFIMFLPTKVAAAWFPDTERTLATTIGVMANPLGVLLANLISPLVVETCEHIMTLNVALSIPSILLTAIATFFITRSEPKVPPTVSAGHQNYPFLQGIVECFSNRQYLVLLLVMGGGIGMLNTLGLASALMITGGVVGATGASIFVDRTKYYEETMKVSMALAVVFGLAFLQLVLHVGLNPWLLAACFIFGVFGLAAYPVGLQLSAECTFPVSETTSTGLVVLSGQIQTIIYLSVMGTMARPLQPDYRKNEVCTLTHAAVVEHLKDTPPTCGHGTLTDAQTVEPKDFTLAVIVMSFIATLTVLVLILAFRPMLRRLEVESRGIRLVEPAQKTASPGEGNELVDSDFQQKQKSGDNNKKKQQATTVLRNSKKHLAAGAHEHEEGERFDLEEVKPAEEERQS